MSAELRARLLPFTLRNAAEKRFYQRHWHGRDVSSITDVAGLPALPTVSKEEYRRCFMFDFDDPGDSHYVSHSTGTTGVLTWRHRTLSEAAVVEHLFAAARSTAADRRPQVAVNITTQYHGMSFPIPGTQVSVPVATYADQEMLHALETLTATFRVHGHEVKPTIVRGTGKEVSLLLHALQEHGVEASDLGIEQVSTLSYLDVGMRRFIERGFGAPVQERFSLSEILGGANFDRKLQAYRLDPYVIGEVLDDRGDQLPPGGVGELTLTELYPLVQMQPLVRYRTGDIVERVEAGEDLAFRWWGRRHECVAAGSGPERRWRFGFRHVADVLSREPAVKRASVRPHLTVVRNTEVGDLLIDVGSGDARDDAQVTISLRHVPLIYSEALDEMVDRLAHALDVSDGPPVRLGVRFENAGSLTEWRHRELGRVTLPTAE